MIFTDREREIFKAGYGRGIWEASSEDSNAAITDNGWNLAMVAAGLKPREQPGLQEITSIILDAIKWKRQMLTTKDCEEIAKSVLALVGIELTQQKEETK